MSCHGVNAYIARNLPAIHKLPAKTLEELKKTLLYNSSIDIWLALCREKGWNWRDIEAYGRFTEYLKQEGIKLIETKMGSPIRVEGKTFTNYAVRFDDTAMAKIRAYS